MRCLSDLILSFNSERMEVLTIDPVTGRVIAGNRDLSLTTNERKGRWHHDGLWAVPKG